MNEQIKITSEIGEIDITLNPYRLGELFADMDSKDQARFLKGLAAKADDLGYKWDIQASYIAEEFKESGIFAAVLIDTLNSIVDHLRDPKQHDPTTTD